MVSTLARKLGIALLAIATIAAPVVGAQPRCCKTGAVKGSGQCCCGPEAMQPESAEREASCCQREARSCCADAEAEAEAGVSPVLADAPCHCKSSSQPPAIPSGKNGSETSLEKFVALADLPGTADASQQALIAHRDGPDTICGGTALHKVHCRWTI
jgi:hypothetical protein